eukprot:2393157-Amphidinium_carterae.1
MNLSGGREVVAKQSHAQGSSELWAMRKASTSIAQLSAAPPGAVVLSGLRSTHIREHKKHIHLPMNLRKGREV